MSQPDAPRRWTIVVNRDWCMGTGQCIVYAPGTFTHDDEAKAIVIDPQGDSLEAIQIAIEGCPTGALSLIEEDEEAGE
jgi:ferredoxin